MPFDDELGNEIRKRADIVKVVGAYLPLVKKGRNFLAKCPFHDDNNPSFTISPEKQMAHCFVCGASGNSITFVQKYLKISYTEAMRKVAELIGFSDPRLEDTKYKRPVDAKKDTILKCLRDISLYYEYALNTEEGKEGLDYFENRHLDASLRSKYHLGYAFKDAEATIKFLQGRGHSLKTIEDTGISQLINGSYQDKNHGRVIFPILDENGDVIGFSARRLNSDSNLAKYVNSPETYVFHKSSVLYNLNIAKDKARLAGHIYICEGFMDVFALGKIGIDNAVATMGTALTNEHVAILRKLNVEIRLCLDGDLPGQTASMKAAKLLEDNGLNVMIVDSGSHSKDPDEILNTEGEEVLRTYVNTLLNRIDFSLAYYQRSNPLKTAEQKKQLIKAFIPVLLGIKSQLDLDNYLRKLSKITGYDVDSLRELLKRSRTVDVSQTETLMASFRPERKALRKLETAERELLYQMINHKEAVAFYEEKIGLFYDEVYRHLANFIVDYASRDVEYDTIDIVTALENSELDNKDELVKEFSTLYLEKTHPVDCSQALLDNLLETINGEKERIFEDDTLKLSLEGKDALEQARIISEFNRRKLKK